MQIQKIHIENYKTYLKLDMDVSVDQNRPIVLIGGMNGGGKTTLFDAIHSALYGLKIEDAQHFRELFNSGVKEIGNQRIVLEVEFTGTLMNMVKPYKLRRTYQLYNGKPVENVRLDMDGAPFSYGTHSPAKEKKENEQIVSKIIHANLPEKLSNYFLFDAMKTSELVNDKSINGLIENNIKMVMGFDKYEQFENVAAAMLTAEKEAKLENEKQREEFAKTQAERKAKNDELEVLREQYNNALLYDTNNSEQYERLKEGRNNDELTRDKIKAIENRIKGVNKEVEDYRNAMDALVKDLETEVLMAKVASMIKNEVEIILNSKKDIDNARRKVLSDEQIEKTTKRIVAIIEQHYLESGTVDVESIINALKFEQDSDETIRDKYGYLSTEDIETLKDIVSNGRGNPFIALDQQREHVNMDVEDLPKQREQLENHKASLSGNDYAIIKKYEENRQEITRLKGLIDQYVEAIKKIDKALEAYDYQIPQVPDPKYDMLCKLPEFFNSLGKKLLKTKKQRIEERMKEQLNLNLVSYSGTIGSVTLSEKGKDGIVFKMYHKSGNEIPLNQLNAGAKQTVMQVLLKVLYEMADYDPPVMIDTVMGVLDKESRATILEYYFPDLADQTILLSTDSEIRTEDDFEKLKAYVSKVYTLHRDKERQCTEISDDYFGIKLDE